MFFNIIIAILVISLFLLFVLLLTCGKVRRLIVWRYSTSLTAKELSYAEEKYLHDSHYPGLLTLKRLNMIILLSTICICLMTVSWKMCSDLMSDPSEEKKVIVEELINTLYKTEPKDWTQAWEELKPKIDNNIYYKLNMTTIDNVTQRHKNWSSERTAIALEIFESDDRYMARYKLQNIVGEVVEKVAIISIDKNNIITGFSEYTLTGNNSVSYMVGQP